jgi:adenosylcobinamide-GDP ribazoletransferase
MRDQGRAALGAVSFLTAVPVGRVTELNGADLRRGVVLFPVVGAAVGVVVALVAWSSAIVLPPLAAAALGVASWAALTAVFHLDGLADVADGVGAGLRGRDPLPAMHDPGLGTFGVVAVVLDLILKVALVAPLAGTAFPWELVAAAAVARLAPIALAWRLPYTGGGTGGWTSSVRARTTITALVLATAIAVPAVGVAGASVMFGAVALVVLVLGRWSRRRIGGVTGDVFGAATELGETLALAAVLATA